MPSISGLNKTQRIKCRDRVVAAAYLALYNKSRVHYTRGSSRWQGIARKLNARKGQYPRYADCSAFATWCLWNGLHLGFGKSDTVNRHNWRGGFTGTMLASGKRVHNLTYVQRGDVAIYGRGRPGSHCAIVVGRRRSDGKIMCVSHGSERGPFLVPLHYRRDLMQVRRFI